MLHVYFDYACPYCLRAHPAFAQLAREGVPLEWVPCEAHPRPDRYGPHSDLLAQGFMLARDTGADVLAYHNLAYSAALEERIDVENLATLAAYMDALLEPEALVEAVASGRYLGELARNNRRAWESECFAAVPSCTMDGRRLPAVEDVGLTSAQIREFAGR